VLRAFAREVVFASRDTNACVATVEEPNRRSWRAFEKAGFRHIRDVEEDGVPHRLLRLDRRYAQ
jgi:RimJ/RimL family protein N-acetyltransferase